MTTPISGKVLLTGADGFIGSHLVEALVRRGQDVRALALYNSFNSYGWLDKCADDVKGKFDVVTGDVRDPHGVRNMMVRMRIPPGGASRNSVQLSFARHLC